MKKILFLCLVLLGRDALCIRIVEPAPILPLSFNLEWPIPQTTIPRSSKFFGSTSGSEGSVTDIAASLIFSNGEVQQLNFSLTRCGVSGICTMVLDPGLLPANSEFTLLLEGPAEVQEWVFSTNDVIDNEPPVVEALTLDGFGVARANVEYSEDVTVLQRVITFTALDATDNVSVIGYDFFGGQTFGVLEKSNGPEAPRGYSDVINEEDAFGVVCYQLTAWDGSGNQGFSEPACIDITISDEERASLECTCISADAKAARLGPFVIFALVFFFRKRQTGNKRHKASVALI